jgi:iron complex transport system ATP-binding protein
MTAAVRDATIGSAGPGPNETAALPDDADRPCASARAPAAAGARGALCEVRDLSAGYGPVVALRDVFFRLDRGDMVAVVGPNGSGKSTLLRVLAGVLRPTAGTVRLDGRDLDRYERREVARRIAVVPQETALEFPFSVTEVVLMGRAPHLGRFGFPGPRDLAIAHEAMRRTGVDALARRSLTELSGGERQRVVIARALAQEPDVLLLDEPTAHLDIRHQVEINDLLAELNHDRGLAIVAVLHDLNLAAMYYRAVAVLADGRIHSLGAPADVLTHATVHAVYGTEAYVARNAVTGAINVLPLGRRPPG